VPSDRPKKLRITEARMNELKENILNGIKKKLTAAESLIGKHEEIAAGIYVYSIEEFGKLVLLKESKKKITRIR
jgi:hypothetical protein